MAQLRETLFCGVRAYTYFNYDIVQYVWKR